MPSAASLSGSIRRPVRLGQPVADGRYAVRQRRASSQDQRRADDRALPDPPLAQVQHVTEQRHVAQPLERLPAARRIAHLHQVRHAVQRHPRQHARQAEAVIAVQVGDADSGDLAGSDPGEQHLHSVPSPGPNSKPSPSSAGVAVVIAGCGRRLARRAENDQLTIGHDARHMRYAAAPPPNPDAAHPPHAPRPRPTRPRLKRHETRVPQRSGAMKPGFQFWSPAQSSPDSAGREMIQRDGRNAYGDGSTALPP